MNYAARSAVGLGIFVAVAAVADYRPREAAKEKQKKGGGPLTIELVPTVDILKTLAATKRPGQIVVGFAAETTEVEIYARRKLIEKRLDWIVANDVSGSEIGMNADNNAIVLISSMGTRLAFGPAAKADVAGFILERVVPR